MKTDAELTTLAKQCARGEWSEDNAFYYLSELQSDACADAAQESAHLGSLLNEARRSRDELVAALAVSLTEWVTLIAALERDGALALEPARMHALIGIERVKRVLAKFEMKVNAEMRKKR